MLTLGSAPQWRYIRCSPCMGQTIRKPGRLLAYVHHKFAKAPRPVKCRVSPNANTMDLAPMADTPTLNTATQADMANAIRALAIDAVQQANSGHPGAPMGMADMAVGLWTKHLKHNPAKTDSNWSAAHRRRP